MEFIKSVVKLFLTQLSWSRESTLTVTRDLKFNLGWDNVLYSYTSDDGMVSIDIDGTLSVRCGWTIDGFSNVPDGTLRRDDFTDDIPLTSVKGWVPLLWRACITHDALYKILGCCDTPPPFSRKYADQAMRTYMYQNGCYTRGTLYYIGVRLFGWVVIKRKRKNT